MTNIEKVPGTQCDFLNLLKALSNHHFTSSIHNFVAKSYTWYIDKLLKSNVADILYERSLGPVVAAVSGACVLIYASVRHSPGHVHRSGDPGHRRGSRSYGNLSDSLQSSTTPLGPNQPIVDNPMQMQ